MWTNDARVEARRILCCTGKWAVHRLAGHLSDPQLNSTLNGWVTFKLFDVFQLNQILDSMTATDIVWWHGSSLRIFWAKFPAVMKHSAKAGNHFISFELNRTHTTPIKLKESSNETSFETNRTLLAFIHSVLMLCMRVISDSLIHLRKSYIEMNWSVQVLKSCIGLASSRFLISSLFVQ